MRRLKRYLADVLAIVSGQDSRHSCWQRGYDQHIIDEANRRAFVQQGMHRKGFDATVKTACIAYNTTLLNQPEDNRDQTAAMRAALRSIYMGEHQ